MNPTLNEMIGNDIPDNQVKLELMDHSRVIETKRVDRKLADSVGRAMLESAKNVQSPVIRYGLHFYVMTGQPDLMVRATPL